MFRIVLVSSLLAISLAAPVNLGLPNVVSSVTDGLPDFSDITDIVTDAVKARFGDLVTKGVGRHVQELIGVQKKLKIVNKIAAEQVKRANAKSGRSNVPVVSHSGKHEGEKNNDEVLASLLFQGDMFLGEDQLDRIIQNTAQELGWGQQVLDKLGVSRPKQSTTRQVIRDIFDFYANHTCLTFEESSTAVPRIQFQNSTSGCFSYVGFRGNDWYASTSRCSVCEGSGLHPVNLGSSTCNEYNYGSIAHEIFHALGVDHQQARSDRDTYLSLSPTQQADNQNTKLTTSDSYNYGTMYDYGSNMHYGLDGFTAKEALYQGTMGSRQGPSFWDIVLINNHYNCMCESSTTTCSNGGYPNPSKCSTCLCPGGFGGSDCLDRDSGTENGGDTLQASTTDSCQTLTTSIGNDDNVANIYYQKSWYWIKAPEGKQVQLFFQKARTSPGVDNYVGNGCKRQGVEIKLKSGEFKRTGTIFCGDDTTIVSTSSNSIPFTSDSELAILQVYSRENKFNLEVKYRYVDSTTSSSIPASCQICKNKYGNCASLADTCDTDSSMPTDCPVTCGTCPT